MAKGTCPVPGCSASVKSGHLMCRNCWHAVPLTLQNAAYRTWRAVQRMKSDQPVKDRLGAIQKYREATDKAVKAVLASRPA